MVNLIVICGHTGVGKTTIGKMISKKLNYVHIKGSEVAEEIKENVGKIWPYEFRKRLYEKMIEKAKPFLKNNESVILDAVFDLEEFRYKARRLAKKFNANFILVRVICDEKIAKKRIKKRYKENPNIPHLKIHNLRKKSFQPIKETHFVINNSYSLDILKRNVEKLIFFISKL
ncbi:MAG: hypothetical protein B6U78_00815 [Candidatus Aenigmarchaeota archaeon ex4484_224]|nr:MAG: hypothetical protein B6U78_00815 [Candidatus Aenigmarchaeota archaeon ex4484_224]